MTLSRLAATGAAMIGTALLCAALPATAEEASAPTSVVLLKTTTTGDGVPLVYPTGAPQILSRITTFPPHSRTVAHRHPTPLYGYILEGQLTIETEGQPTRTYKTGDAFMETAAWHYGHNDGDTPTKLLAVYVGQVDAPLSEPKPAEQPK